MDFSRVAAAREGAEGTRPTGVRSPGPASPGLDADEAAQIVQDGTKETREESSSRSRTARSQSPRLFARRRRELSPLLGVSKGLMTVGIFLISLVAARFISCLKEQMSNTGTARGLFSGATSRKLSDGTRSKRTFLQAGELGPLDPTALQTCFVNPGFIDAEGQPPQGDTRDRDSLRSAWATALPSSQAAQPRTRSWLRSSSVALLLLGTVLCAGGFVLLVVALIMGDITALAPAVAAMFTAAALLVLSYATVLVLSRRGEPRHLPEVATVSSRS